MLTGRIPKVRTEFGKTWKTYGVMGITPELRANARTRERPGLSRKRAERLMRQHVAQGREAAALRRDPRDPEATAPRPRRRCGHRTRVTLAGRPGSR